MIEQLKKLLKELEQKEIKALEIDKAIDLYIEKNRPYKRDSTISYYLDHTKPFIEYAKQSFIRLTSEISNETIDKYVIYLKMRNNANITINIRVKLLLRLLNFLSSINLIDKMDLFFQKLEYTEKDIEVLSIDNLLKVLAITKTKNTKTKLIILMLIATGIRRNELVNIKVKNLDLPKNKIYLDFTKSKKSRYIYTNDEINKLIIKVLSTNKNNVYLFENNKGNQLDKDRITYIVWYMRKQLQLQDLHPHLFRHTYATYLLRNGANLEEVRKLLGHSSIKMTLKYLHLDKEELQRANEQYNILNNIKKALG